MKLRINSSIAIFAATLGLVLALAALRASELNDDIHGILMSAFAKIFSLFPKPDDAEIPAFRADSIFSLTETRLILIFRFIAVALSFFALLSALLARRRGVSSTYYTYAVLMGFGTCFLVHKATASVFAAMALLAIIAIKCWNTHRYNLSLDANAGQRPST